MNRACDIKLKSDDGNALQSKLSSLFTRTCIALLFLFLGWGLNLSASENPSAAPAPDAPTGITASSTEICSGEEVTLSVTDPGNGFTIDWFTDGCGTTAIGSGTSILVTPAVTTTYYAQTREIASGEVSPSCASVTVNVVVTPDIELGAMPVICVNVGVAYLSYTVITGEPSNYGIDWDDEANAVGFADFLNYNLPEDNIELTIPNGGWGISPGTYYGNLRVGIYSDKTCASEYQDISVTITSEGSVITDISVSNNPVCEGTAVTFTANALGATTYRWYVNNEWIAGETGSTFTYTPANGDVVRGLAEIVCYTALISSSTDLMMVVEAAPTATISVDAASCNSVQINFTGTAPWNFDLLRDGADPVSVTGITENPYLYEVSQTGVYTINNLEDAACSGTTAGSAELTADAVAPELVDLSSKSQNLGCVTKPESGGYLASGLGLSDSDFSDNCTPNALIVKEYQVEHNGTTLVAFGEDTGGDASAYAFPEGISTITYRVKDLNNNTSNEQSFTLEFWYLPGVTGITMN